MALKQRRGYGLTIRTPTRTQDARVCLVTDPRVFFTLYPPVHAAGLRAAHLPPALSKHLLTAAVAAAVAGPEAAAAAAAASSSQQGAGDVEQQVVALAQVRV
jgi:hypothetical protein